jgi:hypothetical protein
MRKPEPDRLGIFVGRWRTTGRTTSPDAPAVEIESTDIYEWLPGNHFVVHRWDSRIGEARAGGIEMMGYDAAAGAFRTHFFDSDGNSGTEQLTVEGQTWTWLGANVMGVAWHRCTSDVSDDGNVMTARHEKSDDGVTWNPWMDVTLRREGQARTRM